MAIGQLKTVTIDTRPMTKPNISPPTNKKRLVVNIDGLLPKRSLN